MHNSIDMYIIVTFWIEVSIIQNRNSFLALILQIFQYIFFMSKYISLEELFICTLSILWAVKYLMKRKSKWFHFTLILLVENLIRKQ
jgi:hypothetical protein